MKAIVYTQYGSPDVLQLKEVEKPVPKDGEILVKIQAASANPLDWHLMRGAYFPKPHKGDGSVYNCHKVIQVPPFCELSTTFVINCIPRNPSCTVG